VIYIESNIIKNDNIFLIRDNDNLTKYRKINNYVKVFENNINLSKDRKQLIDFVLRNHSWPYLEKFKKHVCVEHCKNFDEYHNIYIRKNGIIFLVYIKLHIYPVICLHIMVPLTT